MIGTVFAGWLTDTFQAELLTLSDNAYYICKTNSVNVSTVHYPFYGMYFYPEKNKVSLDGGCGLEAMLKIAEAIGLEIEREYVKVGKKRGQTIGYFAQMNR